MILRACERVSPLAVFGRPWYELERAEQIALLGYAWLRAAEESPIPAKP